MKGHTRSSKLCLSWRGLRQRFRVESRIRRIGREARWPYRKSASHATPFEASRSCPPRYFDLGWILEEEQLNNSSNLTRSDIGHGNSSRVSHDITVVVDAHLEFGLMRTKVGKGRK